MEVGVVVVRLDKGSGWLLGDRWVAAEVVVLVAAAVGLGTALLLRLRGAGPCPPSRGHTTGAGRRVRGAGADADAAGPGPRRSIPSPAAFWRGHYQRNCSTRCRCWAGSSWVWCATTRNRASWCRGICRLQQISTARGPPCNILLSNSLAKGLSSRQDRSCQTTFLSSSWSLTAFAN